MVLLTHQQTTSTAPQGAPCPSHTPHPFRPQHVYIAPSPWNILFQILLWLISQPPRFCLNISSPFRRLISGFPISCSLLHLLLTTASSCSWCCPHSSLKWPFLHCLEQGSAHKKMLNKCGLADTRNRGTHRQDKEPRLCDLEWLPGRCHVYTSPFRMSRRKEVGKGVFHTEELFASDMNEGRESTVGIQGLGAIQHGRVGVTGRDRSRAVISSLLSHSKERGAGQVTSVRVWTCVRANSASTWPPSVPTQSKKAPDLSSHHFLSWWMK